MNYNIVSLGGNEKIEINGVRFSGKTFTYWKNRDSLQIKNVVVIFDKKYENINVADGVVILSLTGLSNIQDLMQAVTVFRQIFPSASIQFHFIIDKEQDKQKAEFIGNNLRIPYEIKNANQNIKKMEEEMKNNELIANGSKTIQVEKNTGLENITISDGKAYVNSGNLSIDEEKMLLFKTWQQDPIMSRKIAHLSREELDKLLTESVTRNLTEYRMESAREQTATNAIGEMAMNKATLEDGLVNSELGIVQNNVSNPNSYSAAIKNGENLQMVNPSVTTSQISVSGISNHETTSNDTTSNLKTEEEQSRNIIDQVFYISPEGEVYDSNNNQIGKIGQGYSINYNDNTLLKDGQVIGSIDDYKNMSMTNSNVYSKPKVRTLKKPTGPSYENKSAAFVSVPVIMFIISALLLIASSVLLFILD